MIVLGIDPGYAIVGCGVVEYQSNRFRLLTYGAIITEAHTPFNERIEKIYDEGRSAQRPAARPFRRCAPP